MLIPNKLKIGDEVRVVAPAMNLSIISQETREIANKRFKAMGLKLSFSKYVEEKGNFNSSSIKYRAQDLHEAFSDPAVKMIIAVIGGFNSNQLLDYLDYDLIKNNPKILCGYSDITALSNAIYAKTGLVSYSGPAYSSFGENLYFDYSLDYFKKCLFSDEPFDVLPSKKWSNDQWYIDQKNRQLIDNNGYELINKGEAEGTIIGGNLGTFKLLSGTAFQPSLQNSILFFEDDAEEQIYHFERYLTAISQLPDFDQVKGIVIGRFEKKSKITISDLKTIVRNNKKLDNIPVVCNVDFGHTEPKITFPIGGTAKLMAKEGSIKLEIKRH